MPKKSAGLLLFRFTNDELEFLLVHPGGPFWAKKDTGAWSIPKGEFEDDEEPLHAAIREVAEETGVQVKGRFIELQPVTQKSGKTIYAWAIEQDLDTTKITSNFFNMEWPPKSGLIKKIAEVDKAGWFTVAVAKSKIISGQVPLINEVVLQVNSKK